MVPPGDPRPTVRCGTASCRSSLLERVGRRLGFGPNRPSGEISADRKVITPSIPKKQTDELTPEQQDTLAELELAELRKRERLLQMASSYRGRRWLTLVSFIL